MDTIRQLLRTTRVDSTFHTHVSMIQPRGKFQFNRGAIEEFWKSYCKIISESETLPVLGIAEKPQEYMPVIADIDLKVREEERIDVLYTSEQLKEIISIYQTELRQILEDCTDQDLTCVVLEKKMHSEVKNDISYLKHGFHLHFPYIFLKRSEQETQLIPRVKEEVKNRQIFMNIGLEDSSSAIDGNCCNVPWLVYGCRKNEDSEPYLVTKIYNAELKKVSLENVFAKYLLYDQKEHLINLKGNVREFIPRILSIIQYGRIEKNLKKGLISPLKKKIKNKDRGSTGFTHREISIEEALKDAKELLPMISDKRAEDRTDWLTTGWILYNITGGHCEALELWCEFSARCEDKYDENECIHQWERMTQKTIGLGTLKYWAKIDNEQLYKEYKSKKADVYVEASLEGAEGGSHNDIAKALYAEYGDEFICAGIMNRIWYQFRNHRWEDIEDGVFLREKISSGFLVQKYKAFHKKLCDAQRDADDKATQMVLSQHIKNVMKRIGNLKSSPFKNNVMRECMEVFYDHNFEKKLNVNPYLFPFKNGVYDLENNIFRIGRPEDYISKTSGINYVLYQEDDDLVQRVHTFLEQLFPDKSLRSYFLDNASDVFEGGNKQKIAMFWTGEGNNGKSVLQLFFDKMLGDLSIKFNTTIITSKKPQTGSANPDLARAGNGVRWAVIEEPDGDESINVGTLKHLTGNDSYFARDLFEKGKKTKEIMPLFKLIIICNKLPRLKFADAASFIRVRILPFEAVFCKDGVPETYEKQLLEKKFPMDKNFSDKIPELVEAFAWVLLEHRKKITKRDEPDKVLQATNSYRRQNDNYRQFVEELIAEDSRSTISLSQIYEMFKTWIKDSLPHHPIPIKIDVEEYFTKIWGTPCQGKKWKGYRPRTDQDNVNPEDIIELVDTDLEFTE